MIRAGIDWGSSSFRAYQFDRSAEVVESISADIGIKFIANGNFEAALFEQIAEWLHPGDQVLLSGMITSRNGWTETPYVECPANLELVLRSAVRKSIKGIELIFLPGLCQQNPLDVMRGEEIQLFGAESVQPTRLAVMPGTHSKWATIDSGEIVEFHTIATGELFDVLLKHTLIGNLYTDESWEEDAFAEGVQRGFHSRHIIRELFTCRAGILLKQLPASSVFSYLSGLLIGNEIREGSELTALNLQGDSTEAITLIGSASLCHRYLSAFTQLDINAKIGLEDAVVPGFKKIISMLPNFVWDQ
ncbi:MAG: hypothetical protein GKR96_01940 [Gammaproteobacteria bacterium]|nr:hypothetical protein [Gammaproteobacteria bacterium]